MHDQHVDRLWRNRSMTESACPVESCARWRSWIDARRVLPLAVRAAYIRSLFPFGAIMLSFGEGNQRTQSHRQQLRERITFGSSQTHVAGGFPAPVLPVDWFC
jgi:hypothetical protein